MELELRPHQTEVIDALREGFRKGHKSQLLYAPTGFGKCLAPDTPVIMYDGTIKPVQDIVVGDLLLSPEGEPRLVNSTVSGVDMMYKITPSKGEAYCVNSSHILSLRMTGNNEVVLGGDGKRYSSGSIANISIKDYLASSKTFKHCAKGWRADGIDFKINTPLPVEPYLLGAWLGDGTTKEPAITNIDPEIIDYIHQFAREIGGRISVWDNGNCCTYRICGGDFLSSMRSIGVMGNKHIPHQYKTASIEARQKLLAGIIDTDGHMFMNNFDIILKVKTLADDICFVARSLGFAAYVRQCTKTIKSTGFSGTYYRIIISGDTDQIPCLVPRKQAKPRGINKNPRNVGVQVQEAGLGKYYGFSIAGDKKLFLLGDFTVTHNTEVAIALMRATAEKFKRAAIVLDRIVLVDQTSMRLTKYGLNHGVYQAGHWKFDRSERLQVCSAQTLESRDDFPVGDLLIIDECFSGETLISTPSGCLPIKLVRNGDKVYTASGIGTVLQTMVRPATELYTLEFDDGSIITCTGNHPIFTERGWVRASELAVGALSFSEQGVLELWSYLQAKNDNSKESRNCSRWREEMGSAENLLSILLAEMPPLRGVGNDRSSASQQTLPELRGGVQAKEKNSSWSNNYGGGGGFMGEAEILLSEVRHESRKPDEQSPDQKEDDCHASGNQTQADQEGWKWSIAAAAAACLASCVGRGLGIGGGNSHGIKKYRAGLSNKLQDRHSEQRQEDGDRGGRPVTRHAGKANGRRTENRIPSVSRLVNISRVERESVTPVFNLHVSGHPSYFANGKLVHNCHIGRKQTTEFIKANPGINVVGLTATPFTKGLGSIYQNVICGATNNWLVDNHWLTPLKVFIAKEIDMTGAKKIGGEWSQEIATERGMKITGDIVAEWIKKTHEVFGRPRKTIVFCSGVAHGADLVQQFAEKGYNFVSISYKDNDEYKREAIEDFSKPDTEIHGLIATDILTRGFDVSDVMIGVSARPFSKSFSSHVQQMGRVMRPHEGKDFALWLDHSGNFLRFRSDWDDLYVDGVSDLDNKEEKAKKELTEKEKKESKCPVCGHLWPKSQDTCPGCGHVRQRRNEVVAVAGELIELAGGARAGKDDKQAFYSELMYYAREHAYNPHWASHKYKEKFGMWPRGLSETPSITSLITTKWIRSRNIAWAKSRRP